MYSLSLSLSLSIYLYLSIYLSNTQTFVLNQRATISVPLQSKYFLNKYTTVKRNGNYIITVTFHYIKITFFKILYLGGLKWIGKHSHCVGGKFTNLCTVYLNSSFAVIFLYKIGTLIYKF